jgi:predicted DsbA family dithiol-disulfide isomerase
MTALAVDSKKKLHIDVWSDIACPWCYVGKRHLEAALAEFPHAAEVEVQWRAFELDPAAPNERDRDGTYAGRIAKKYGCSEREAEIMIKRMVDTAKSDGLDFHFERIRSGNMFDAHRVLHLAHDRDKQDAVKERFLLAYMTEGALMSDAETLVRLASEAGLDAEEVRKTLLSDRYEREVRADERDAKELGISGVPFFVVGGKYAISGAQPSQVLLRALTLAWREQSAKPVALQEEQEGAVCGPEGCT